MLYNTVLMCYVHSDYTIHPSHGLLEDNHQVLMCVSLCTTSSSNVVCVLHHIVMLFVYNYNNVVCVLCVSLSNSMVIKDLPKNDMYHLQCCPKKSS